MSKKQLPKLPTDIQRVFLASRINGAVHVQADEQFFIDWPKGGWFQKRRALVLTNYNSNYKLKEDDEK